MAFTRAISANLNQFWQFLAYGHRRRRGRETSSRDIRVCSGVHVGEYHDVDGIDGADDGRDSAANYNYNYDSDLCRFQTPPGSRFNDQLLIHCLP